MSRKASVWLPCASDFEAGEFWRGGAGVLMQGTLVFWPVAYRLARRAAARRAMDEQLRLVAAVYGLRPAVARHVGVAEGLGLRRAA